MTVVRNGNFDRRKIKVDALIVSAGWTPSVHLFSQSRGKLRFDEVNQRFLPDIYAQNSVSVGGCNGTNNSPHTGNNQLTWWLNTNARTAQADVPTMTDMHWNT